MPPRLFLNAIILNTPKLRSLVALLFLFTRATYRRKCFAAGWYVDRLLTATLLRRKYRVVDETEPLADTNVTTVILDTPFAP